MTETFTPEGYQGLKEPVTIVNGLIDVTGLKYGTYYLEETKAPEKYVPLTNRVAFTIDEQSYV
ncbi:prealbumin-like fold domain-containing protein, partial [Enterococcus faecium]|nr:prealbumin-like fold domain-containing protein [Enterococcus faecium]NTR50550.1 prealbumin-like fold domain-containing protein [Enterococcus faecium]NTR52929.1 prealbumin-like fold domain-containing protein [Enterococcus faecium]NTS01735.1 prealbumin-like fold domain-containing protein [Enterococcus faecium]